MLLSVAHRSSAKGLRHVRSYAATPHAVSSDGTRIAYTTTAGGGTPTLLINGWAGCAADWGSLVDRLGGSGRRIVAFDPRGFGASGDGAAASVRTLSEDALAVARAVGSSEAPVDIIGWSLGGLVAQELCCVAPSEVRRAVLASTSPGGDDFDKRVVEWLAADFKQAEGVDLMKDKQALQRLTEAAEKAKMELSSTANTLSLIHI